MKQRLQAARRSGVLAKAQRRQEDAELLKKVGAWMRDTADLTEAALDDGSLAGNCVFPPCVQCGGDVDGFQSKNQGRMLIRFSPCGCRVVLHQPRPRGSGRRGMSVRA